MTDHIKNQQPAANDPVAMIAALVSGDRWLSADACAAYLGGITRRTFLETIACKPNFPKALPLGKIKAWKKSELEDWAQNYRRAA
jgi:predicted DNA-binding transcriptional regulator AlpA